MTDAPTQAALRRGDFRAACAELEAAVAECPSAEAHELLAGVCLILEDIDAARRHGEAAYRLYREADKPCRAAATALHLAHLHDFCGNTPAMQGWLARARRLLDEVGPCVERGYYDLIHAGCEVRDVAELEARAGRALALAQEFHDPDLEARALADSGLALVSQGRIAEGLARLDEAMTAVVAGEVHQHLMAGLTCCSMLTACERVGDMSRATQWTEAVEIYATDRFGNPPPPVLFAHCRIAYGNVLAEAGRWDDAEQHLVRALEVSRNVAKRAGAAAGLADLRISQGRLAEADELLRPWADRPEAGPALARLHFARGEMDLAAATLERVLRGLETDRLTSAPLLALLVDVGLARNDLPAAAAAAARLEQAAEDAAMPSLLALAQLANARLARAQGERAADRLTSALALLADGTRPHLAAEIHLELASELQAGDPAAAVTEARAALAMFDRLGARRDADRAAALLRALGVNVRASGDDQRARDVLSKREREVLDLVAEGLSNAQIGARLFISAKTAEHHVGSILTKLGLKTRAEAAAFAATRPPVGAG